MRAASLLVLMAWSLLGCPRRENDSAPPSSPMGSPAGRGNPNHCALEERSFVPMNEPVESPWLVRGPDGPRVIGRTSSLGHLFWRDVHGEATTPDAPSPSTVSLAWSGRGFVGVSDGRATFTDARFSAPRAVRHLSFDRAAPNSITAVGRDGAALVAWLKEARAGDQMGAPWVALVGPSGELLMEPRPLAEAPTSLRALHARWDFGRFVLEGESVDGRYEWLSWVLDPDGRAAWAGPGRVVCPRSGCLRMDYGAGPGGRAQALRLAPLGESGAAVDTNIFTDDVRAVTVSGDRVLVLHSPLQGELGCAVHVYDVGHREVAHESSSESMSCEAGSALATPSGFVILEVDAARGLDVRALSCGDDA